MAAVIQRAEYIPGTQMTVKRPGHLVLGDRGQLLRVNDAGVPEPYVMPHRREQIERAEAFRARMAERRYG